MADTSALTVEVPTEVVARLEELAARTGQSTSELTGEALAAYLAFQESEFAAIQDAVDADTDDAPFVEHEKVAAWLRTWGTERESRPPT